MYLTKIIGRQQQLRKACMKEHGIRKLGMALQHGKKIETSKAFLSLHDAVPCILHLENRVGLKFFTMLLHSGLSNAVSGKTFSVLTAKGNQFDAFFCSERHCEYKCHWNGIQSGTMGLSQR